MTTPRWRASSVARDHLLVKYGVVLFATDETIAPAVLGPALEERGFDALFVPEHSHIPASRESPAPAGGDLPRHFHRTIDVFVTLAVVAATTTRLGLGTGGALLRLGGIWNAQAAIGFAICGVIVAIIALLGAWRVPARLGKNAGF